ncbi:MAG: hypothetical protein HXY50_00890 [Ignavibacteriaceae bacterium]|nr:hypothetical protein [Ignavibacteriaceae bacterium]
MKKTILLLLGLSSIIYFGCEKEYDSVVDQSTSTFQVTSVRTIESFRYIPGDSLLLISVTFENSEDISTVYVDIISSAGQALNSNSVKLYDNGNTENGDLQANDNTYSNKFPLSQTYPNGDYLIKYYVLDNNNVTKQVAIQKFKYDNGQTNVAPIISNTIIEPDTLVVNDTTVIQISVQAQDQNGNSDIECVFFVVYKPDGSTNNFKNELFDSGNNSLHGDQIPADGIYSLKIQVDQTNNKGTYRFEFQARDRGKKISNIINHFVLIQ